MTDELNSESGPLRVTRADRAWGFYVTSAGMTDVPPKRPYSIEPDSPYEPKEGRGLPDYSVAYVVRGGGKFHSREIGEQAVEAGDLIVRLPGVWHSHTPNRETGWAMYWVTFNGVLPERLAEHGLVSAQYPLLHPGLNETILDLFRMVVKRATEGPDTGRQVLSALTYQILALVLSGTDRLLPVGAGATREIEQSIRYLEEHLQGPVDMKALATSVNMSYHNFRRRFKEATGVPPQHYHIQMKLSRAKDLLANPQARVSEIAVSLGFGDPFYFSRIFKKYTGCSPAQWRETKRQSSL